MRYMAIAPAIAYNAFLMINCNFYRFMRFDLYENNLNNVFQFNVENLIIHKYKRFRKRAIKKDSRSCKVDCHNQPSTVAPHTLFFVLKPIGT